MNTYFRVKIFRTLVVIAGFGFGFSPSASAELIVHVVKPGETLQDISDQYYQTTRHWEDIYHLNRKTLKSPDRVEPGTQLRLPIGSWANFSSSRSSGQRKPAMIKVKTPSQLHVIFSKPAAKPIRGKETDILTGKELYPAYEPDSNENTSELDIGAKTPSTNREPAFSNSNLYSAPVEREQQPTASEVLKSKSSLPFYNEMIDK